MGIPCVYAPYVYWKMGAHRNATPASYRLKCKSITDHREWCNWVIPKNICLSWVIPSPLSCKNFDLRYKRDGYLKLHVSWSLPQPHFGFATARPVPFHYVFKIFCAEVILDKSSPIARIWQEMRENKQFDLSGKGELDILSRISNW